MTDCIENDNAPPRSIVITRRSFPSGIWWEISCAVGTKVMSWRGKDLREGVGKVFQTFYTAEVVTDNLLQLFRGDFYNDAWETPVKSDPLADLNTLSESDTPSADFSDLYPFGPGVGFSPPDTENPRDTGTIHPQKWVTDPLIGPPMCALCDIPITQCGCILP